MDLSKSELRAFNAILQNPGIGLEQFMSKTDLSKPRAYYILSELKSNRLIRSEGRPSRYSILENEKASQLSRLFKIYGSYPLDIVLSNKNYSVLKEILDEQKNSGQLMKATGLSRSQVYRILSRFAQMGLVKNFNEDYYVSEDHPLYKCLVEYGQPPEINHELEQNGVVLWQDGAEYLIQTDNLKKYVSRIERPWKLTSTSAVGMYGIDVIPPKTTVYVTDKKTHILERSEGDYTSLEDTLVFTLLQGTPDSKKYARYLILLHKNKIDLDYLKKAGKRYGIARLLESILYDLKPVLQK